MTAPKDITGERFGRLVAVSKSSSTGERSRWLCKCDCGRESTAFLANLQAGRTQSCGCYNRQRTSERRRVHGETHLNGRKERSRLYVIWVGMQQRCHNPRNPSYINYGARGIVVCHRWRSSFEAFRDDMGGPPNTSHSIERIDNDGPYSPGNCRWADAKTQIRNRRKTLRVTYRGMTASIAEHAERNNIPYSTLVQRLKGGWPVEQAIETPWGTRRPAR